MTKLELIRALLNDDAPMNAEVYGWEGYDPEGGVGLEVLGVYSVGSPGLPAYVRVKIGDPVYDPADEVGEPDQEPLGWDRVESGQFEQF